jgi:putative membrane protein
MSAVTPTDPRVPARYLTTLQATRFISSTLLLLAGATTAIAHEAGPHDFAELRTSWAFEPGVVIPLIIAAWLYFRGMRRLRAASQHALGLTEVFCYAAGWLTLVVALVSPLHPWGSVLFSAHMTQHELLMLVAAPLLVLGRPMIPFLWALPKKVAREISSWTKARWWRAIWTAMTAPFVAWLIHAVVLWTWHLPVLFQATLDSEFIHALQHASFLGSALLFWWAVLHGRQRAMGFGVAVLYMFTTALHSGLLGALLTFARTLWYPIYSDTTQPWGLSPIEDQQLGGLIMWIPAGVVYIIAGLALFAGWLRESDNRARGIHALAKVSLIAVAMMLVSCGPSKESKVWAADVTGGDPARGRTAIQHYGCIACHTVDGIRQSEAMVGPPLLRMASRSYLAGNLENNAANMIRFIQHPKKLHSDTAMPEMGVTDQDAKDIAAYLYCFR